MSNEEVREPLPDEGQDPEELLDAADGMTSSENHRYEEGVV